MDAGLGKNPFYAQLWAQRASAELGAAKRFKSIHNRLEEQASHRSILQLVSDAIADEENHALLCAKTAKNLGHKSGFSDNKEYSPPGNPSWHTLNEPKKLLLDIVLMSCVVESINANLMNTLFINSKDYPVNELIRKILKDEIKHGKIGWAYLKLQNKNQDLSFVSENLEEMLDLAVRNELFNDNDNEHFENSFEFGILPREDRIEQFCDSLENLVQPGLEHFGIESSTMTYWLKSKAPGQFT